MSGDPACSLDYAFHDGIRSVVAFRHNPIQEILTAQCDEMGTIPAHYIDVQLWVQ